MTAHAPDVDSRIDPISLEVFHSLLLAATQEMAEALRRSAYSPIIREMLDYSCGVFDLSGALVAQAEGIPALLGTMSPALKEVLRRYPPETLQEGDAFITNDPYSGGSHTPDVLVFTPAWHNDRALAICGTIAHHVDVGGKNPGTEGFDNKSIFEEGLRIPPMRLMSGGAPVDAVYDLVAANVRDPRATMGDLRAQIAACRFGERRLIELARRNGPMFDTLLESVLDYVERRTRAELAELPDGEASATGYLDDDGVGGAPVAITARVSVRDTDVEIDFTGTSPQIAGGLNMPFASTIAATLYSVKAIVDPEGPQNDGVARAIRIVAPRGSLLNPEFPAAVSLRHLTEQRTADVILRAFAELYPDRGAAGTFVGFSSLALEARDIRTGALTVLQDDLGGGTGAWPGGDGVDAVDTHLGNVGHLPAEICETQYPVRIRFTELRPDSAGRGRWRGGLGIRRLYEFLPGSDVLVAYTEQSEQSFAPWGLAGGSDGEPARLTFLPAEGEPRVLKKEVLRVQGGDRLLIETGGGGGYGDQAERDPGALEADWVEGKLTRPE